MKIKDFEKVIKKGGCIGLFLNWVGRLCSVKKIIIWLKKQKQIMSSKENSGFKELLDREEYANTISRTIIERIDNAHEGFVFGISGRWGEGKSTLLDLIAHKLQKNSDIMVIRFNAWKYSETKESLRREFIELLSEKLAPNKKIDRLKFEFSLVKINWLYLLGMIAVFSFILFLIFKYISNELFRQIISSGLFAGFLGLVFSTIQIKKSYTKITTCDEFEEIFKEILECYEKPFVVFIDDLDRCTPSGVYRVIGAIKTFFQDKRCNFVITGDYSVIERYLGSKLHIKPEVDPQKTAIKEEIEGQRYLKKIFNIYWNIPLPEPSIFRNYIEEKMNEIVPYLTEGVLEEGRKRDVRNNIIALFEKFMKKNPRNVERFLSDLKFRLDSVMNQINVQENITKIENLKTILQHPDLLAKIQLIKELFYDEYTKIEDNIEDNPDYYQENEKKIKGGAALEYGPEFVETESHKKAVYEKLLGTPPYCLEGATKRISIEPFIYSTGLSAEVDVGISWQTFNEMVYSNKPELDAELKFLSEERRGRVIADGISNFSEIPEEQKWVYIQNIFPQVFQKYQNKDFLSFFLDNTQVQEYYNNQIATNEERKNILIELFVNTMSLSENVGIIFKKFQIQPWVNIQSNIEEKIKAIILQKIEQVKNFENTDIAQLNQAVGFLRSISEVINCSLEAQDSQLFNDLSVKLRSLYNITEKDRIGLVLDLLMKNISLWGNIKPAKLSLFKKGTKLRDQFPEKVNTIWNSWNQNT